MRGDISPFFAMKKQTKKSFRERECSTRWEHVKPRVRKHVFPSTVPCYVSWRVTNYETQDASATEL